MHTLVLVSVTVLTPVRNSAKHLALALESLRRQTLKDWVCVIGDNGSTDESLKIATRYVASDGRFRMLECPGLTLPDLRNRLIEEADSEFIAWVDSDDVILPDRLLQQRQYLLSNSDVVACGSAVDVIDPIGLPIRSQCPPVEHDGIIRNIANRKGIGMFFPSSMMRTSAVRRIGGFTAGFDVAEDVDLILRLAEIGKLANLSQSLTKYRWRTESLSWRDKQKCLMGVCQAIQNAVQRGQFPIETLDRLKSIKPLSHHEEYQILVQWGRAAVHAGNHWTATRLACRSLTQKLKNPAAWQLLSEAVFPIAQNGQKTLLDSIMRLPKSIFRRGCLLMASICRRSGRSQES